LSSSADPRVYFAAERTLLAWVRTGIAVMGFGFIVGRFGDFLAVASDDSPDAGLGVTPLVGAALIGLGAVSIAAGAMEYRRYTQTLRPEDLPSPRASRLPLTLAWLLVALGLVLVVVLLV
jgi:putative membrane protein